MVVVVVKESHTRLSTGTVQEEPAFIKRFKEKVGYVEDEQDIDAKVCSN